MTFWKPKATWTPAAIARCLRVREEQVRATLKVVDSNHSIAAWELDLLRRQVRFALQETQDFLSSPVIMGEERETLGRIARDMAIMVRMLAQTDFLHCEDQRDEAFVVGERMRLSYSSVSARLAALPPPKPARITPTHGFTRRPRRSGDRSFSGVIATER